MQSAQETSAVRTTESSWRTSLRAIARKAVKEPNHRFGGLYRLLNEASRKECFLRLRKDAAPGIDGVRFAQYAQHLDENVADLVQRLKNKSYRARLVRRKYIPKAKICSGLPIWQSRPRRGPRAGYLKRKSSLNP